MPRGTVVFLEPRVPFLFVVVKSRNGLARRPGVTPKPAAAHANRKRARTTETTLKNAPLF